ncbi:MAG: ankyrin repeat domain-containing protein, partial [Terracidiphilus sp.]
VLLSENPDLVFSKGGNGDTPLLDAATHNHKDVAEFLLTRRADIGAKNNWGCTALSVAADSDYKDMVELLLANKADVNAKP